MIISPVPVVCTGSDNYATHCQWLSLLAHLFIQQQKFAKAIVILEASLTLRPDAPETLKALAVAYLRKGDSAKALTVVTKLLESAAGIRNRKPQWAPLWLVRARALQQLGDSQAARQAMQQYSQWRSANES